MASLSARKKSVSAPASRPKGGASASPAPSSPSDDLGVPSAPDASGLSGAPGGPSADSIRLGLVVSDFNDAITSRMESSALLAADDHGARVARTLHVVGAFDIPLIADLLAARPDIDGIVALGAVVKGDTGHDRLVTEACARALADISLRRGKPVALGVIGPDCSESQADARAEEYGRRAVEAALKSVRAAREARG